MSTDIVTSSPETDQVFAAFVKAQAAFGTVTKASDSNRGKFASFPDIVEHVKPILSAEGLFYTQLAVPHPNGAMIVTKVCHSSGQWFSDAGTLIPAAKLDPQGAGASYSFARRYGLQAVCGLAADEDNGETARESIEKERREAAQAAAAATRKLTDEQRDILTTIMTAAGNPTPQLDDKLEADYPTHLRAALGYAVKQNVVEAGDADDLQKAGLKLDAATVRAGLGVAA